MNNIIKFFEKFPLISPQRLLQEQQMKFDSILSGMNKMMQNNFCIYPYDIYNKLKDGKVVATVIQIALAGFVKQDCQVKIKENILSLNVSKKQKNKDDQSRQYIVNKLAYRTSQLSWTLNPNCDKENISVKFKDGLLTIQLPMVQKKQVNEQKNIVIE